VLIYLASVFGGLLSRYFLRKWKGADWYDNKFIPKISPITLIALLFTIIVMFSLRVSRSSIRPWTSYVSRSTGDLFYSDVLRVVLYGQKIERQLQKTVTIAFHASGNNFELAIAVAVGVFGIASGQAFAAVIGPLIEVPTLCFL